MVARSLLHRVTLALAAVAAVAAFAAGASAQQAPAAGLAVPIDYYKLPNGLKVVLSRDTTAPTAVVAVYYNIGFRNEPQGPHRLRAPVRAPDVPGLAQPGQDGVHQAGRAATAACSTAPPGSTSPTISRSCPRTRSRPCSGPRPTACAAWRSTPGQPQEPAGRGEERGPGQRAEPALRRLPVDRPADGGQHQLVQRPQLLRRPGATSTPRRWTTSSAFFRTFYAPNNAVLVVVGRLRPGAARGLDREVLRRHPAPPTPPQPDLTEPRQDGGEARRRRPTRWRTRPALGLAYHVPRAQHARVVRLRPARPDPGPGEGQPAVRGAGAEARPHRRRDAGGSTGASATCTTTTGRCCGSSRHLPRRRQAGRLDGGRVRRGDRPLRTPPLDAGAARPRAVTKLRSELYAEHGAVLGLRARRPAGRRSPCSTTTRGGSTGSRREFAKITPELMPETARRPARRPTGRSSPSCRGSRRDDRDAPHRERAAAGRRCR